MPVPVRVTFRDMPPSATVTKHIEKHAAKLQTLFDRMIDCHVVVEEPHRHKKNGKKFHVRVDMHVPGKELVASRNLDDATEDLYAAIDDAFSSASRLLDDHVRQLHPESPVHQRPPHGVVAKIFLERGYGFIEADDDSHEVYFHRNSVIDGHFESITVGTKVRFAEEDGDKGPQASTVHVIGSG